MDKGEPHALDVKSCALRRFPDRNEDAPADSTDSRSHAFIDRSLKLRFFAELPVKPSCRKKNDYQASWQKARVIQYCYCYNYSQISPDHKRCPRFETALDNPMFRMMNTYSADAAGNRLVIILGGDIGGGLGYLHERTACNICC